MKTVCIVQARTGSTRFPCKILASLHGRPMLAHVLERAAAIHGVDQVVLAVPESDVRFVNHLWPHVYGGSELDVLRRYAVAARKYEADTILRITGDCPLFAPDIVDLPLRLFNIHRDYYPYCQPYFPVADGWDCEMFSSDVLGAAQFYASNEHREHVTTWMRVAYPRNGYDGSVPMDDWTALKCSVDTEADLARVSLIMDHLEDKNDFSHTTTWRAWELAGRP